MPNTYAANWCFQSKCSNISAEGLHFSAFHYKLNCNVTPLSLIIINVCDIVRDERLIIERERNGTVKLFQVETWYKTRSLQGLAHEHFKLEFSRCVMDGTRTWCIVSSKIRVIHLLFKLFRAG